LSKPFAAALRRWYLRGSRRLPWRGAQDPYRIWVSEIMLQQTRVQTVIPYYQRFLARFPDVESLARAPEADVLECWSGLGYYSRARNLQRAARLIAEQGRFPRDYESIRRLPGIGDYTAAAVASIAFGLPYAAVDGNVLRVMARIANDPGEIGSAATRKRFRDMAMDLLDRRDPGTFNQAMMELGATVCLPRQPLCNACPVAGFCAARKAGTESRLPAGTRKSELQQIELTLALVERRGRFLMWRRGAEARRLAGFWELPEARQLPGFEPGEPLGSFQHTITNHRYQVAVIRGSAPRAPRGWRWIEAAAPDRPPLSTMTRKALALHARPPRFSS
jgi:A/G-specific adenine glycosylase